MPTRAVGLEYYRLQGPHVDKCAEWVNNSRRFVGTYCPLDPKHVFSAKKGRLDIRYKYTKRHPMIWTVYAECLLRHDLVHRFKKEGFNGLELVDATVRFRGGEVERDEYKEVVVTGWGGRARPESGIHLVRHCPGCGAAWYTRHTNPGEILDPTQWDGSDFFMIWPLPSSIMITGRVADWLRANKIEVCTYGDVTLADPLIAKTKPIGSPGPLDNYMPRDRALQLAPDLVGPGLPPLSSDDTG
jgi:hypothetical protein